MWGWWQAGPQRGGRQGLSGWRRWVARVLEHFQCYKVFSQSVLGQAVSTLYTWQEFLFGTRSQKSCAMRCQFFMCVVSHPAMQSPEARVSICAVPCQSFACQCRSCHAVLASACVCESAQAVSYRLQGDAYPRLWKLFLGADKVAESHHGLNQFQIVHAVGASFLTAGCLVPICSPSPAHLQRKRLPSTHLLMHRELPPARPTHPWAVSIVAMHGRRQHCFRSMQSVYIAVMAFRTKTKLMIWCNMF